MKRKLILILSIILLNCKRSIAQSGPSFIQGGWSSKNVVIRASALELKSNIGKTATKIFSGAKNSIITISKETPTNEFDIQERINIDIGGYYTGNMFVREVSYKYEYSFDQWTREISYEVELNGVLGSIYIKFDSEKFDKIEGISGFLIFRGEKKKNLYFKLEGWLNIDTQ